MLHPSCVKITDALPREPEWVPAQVSMEAEVNELPVERDIVGNEHRSIFRKLVEPTGELFHQQPWIGEGDMFLAGDAAKCEGLRNKSIGDASRRAEECSFECCV